MSHFLISIKVSAERLSMMTELLVGEDYTIRPCKTEPKLLEAKPKVPEPIVVWSEEKNQPAFARELPLLAQALTPAYPQPTYPVTGNVAIAIMDWIKDNPRPFQASDPKMLAFVEARGVGAGSVSAALSRLHANGWITTTNPGRRPSLYMATPLTPEQLAAVARFTKRSKARPNGKPPQWYSKTPESQRPYGKEMLRWLKEEGPKSMDQIATHFLGSHWNIGRVTRVAYAIVREGAAKRIDGDFVVE